MARILLQSFNQGGIADSIYSGVKNSFSRMVGWNIHEEVGILKTNHRMAKHSGSTIDELCKVGIAASNGINYWFSSASGKIWQDKNGTYSLVYTTVAPLGESKCLGAYEYQGVLYWASQARLWKIPLDGTKADGAANWTTNAADAGSLSADQTALSGSGQTYPLTAAVNEGATHKQTFTMTNSVLAALRVNISATGTGVDWTIVVHDASNNVIGSVTKLAASLATGLTYFEFATPLQVTAGGVYHAHLYASATTGTPAVVTGTTNDFETSQLSIYTLSDADYHPMVEVNLILFIGDRNFVHQVDGTTLTRDALDLEKDYRVTALGKMGTDLLVGTIIDESITRCEIFRWNTYSETFANSDRVYEAGINAFLEVDNFVIVSAGDNGNLYQYNGDKLYFFRKIPSIATATTRSIVYPNATTMFRGNLPLFGLSNIAGNPSDQGIYSLARHSNNYPQVLNLEWPISKLDGDSYHYINDVKIGAMFASGRYLYASWSYNDADFGIDRLDYDQRVNKTILETRLMSPSAGLFTSFNEFIVTFQETFSDNVTVVLKYKANGATSWSTLTLTKDTMRNQLTAQLSRLEARTLQLRLEVTAYQAVTPKIQELIIDVT